MLRQHFFNRVIVSATVTAMLLSSCSIGAAPTGAPMAAPAAADAYTAAPAEAYAEAAMEAPAYGMPDEPVDMFFEDYGVRGFVTTEKDNLSTFAVDVDTGSYTVARAYVEDGLLPERDSVRAEEFINYFDYRYPNPAREDTFDITVDGGVTPFLDRADNRMVRVGIQSYAIPADERKDVALTFVIDVSGSMDMDNRLGLAKRALYELVDELRPTDEVAIVVYGDAARVVLPMTSVAEKGVILNAIGRLAAEGATNAEAGLFEAYRHASSHFKPDAVNRVVLISDGVANVGNTGPDAILRTIADYAGRDITLTTVGVGMDNYNDTLMEQLADDGDGFYAYVDTIEEAHRIFVERLPSTLQVVGKDAKIQVEFNPAVVARYRLVGYENRNVADDDFRNDEVDAGEIGVGHSVTALYEVEPVAGMGESTEPAITVRLRWEEPETAEVIEAERTVALADLHAPFTDSAPRFQLAAAVAEYAELLKGSPFAYESSLDELQVEVDRINRLIAEVEGAEDEAVNEFVRLVTMAAAAQE
jgi:Ca-activated chloride channel family protein